MRGEDLESKALRLILESGENGILQSELWKKLNVSSREGSRISLKLERRGVIKREKELHNGRWTYRLFPKRKVQSLDSIADCPCTHCPNINKCEVGGEYSPTICADLTNWLYRIAEKERAETVK